MGICISLATEQEPQPVHQNELQEVKLEEVNPDNVESVPLKGKVVPAKLIECHDGDTIRVIMLHGGAPMKISIRILGIDTPEIMRGHDRLPEEHDAGIKARDYLRSLLSSTLVKVKVEDWDKFGGRLLGHVYTSEGGDVSELMIQGGWARAYHGEKKREWTLEELTSPPFVQK